MKIAQVAPLLESVPPQGYGGTERVVSYLTEELMREMDLFQYQAKGNDLVVSDVSDQEGWKKIKETLIKGVGMGSVPVIKIEDCGYGDSRTLYAKHDHAPGDVDLRCGKADSVGGEHRLDHVVHELAHAVVDTRDARRLGGENVVVIRRHHDGKYCHVTSPRPDSLRRVHVDAPPPSSG